jgi:hypothetical protein
MISEGLTDPANLILPELAGALFAVFETWASPVTRHRLNPHDFYFGGTALRAFDRFWVHGMNSTFFRRTVRITAVFVPVCPAPSPTKYGLPWLSPYPTQTYSTLVPVSLNFLPLNSLSKFPM